MSLQPSLSVLSHTFYLATFVFLPLFPFCQHLAFKLCKRCYKSHYQYYYCKQQGLLCNYFYTNPGGHLHWKVVQGCSAVMTPFFQASRRSLAYQFTINAPLMCPNFQFLDKCCIFSLVFGQNFSSHDTNFPNFRSQTPYFSRKIRSLDPTFGNSCGTRPPKKS